MPTINMNEVEAEVTDALTDILKENPNTLEKYIVGSVLDGWEQVTRDQPYDIDVTIPDDITLTRGDLGTANRNLYMHELTINGEEFSLHLHNHDVDTSRPYHKF